MSRLPWSAFCRLLWRPVLLAWALLIAVFALAPGLLVAGGPRAVLAALRTGSADPGSAQALADALFVLPAVAGLFTGLAVRNVESKLFGWMLPGMYTVHALSLTGLALLASLPAVAVAATAGAGPAGAILAFDVLVFCAAFSLFDRVATRGALWVGPLVGAAGWLRADDLLAAVVRHETAALAALPVGLLLLPLSYGRGARRTRLLLPPWRGWFASTGDGAPEARDGKQTPYRRLTSSSGAGTLAWVHALRLERFGGVRGGAWTNRALMLAVGSLMLLFMGTSGGGEVWVVIAGMAHTLTPGPLLPVPYPLSRGDRARVTWASSLLDNLQVAAVLGAGVLLLHVVQVSFSLSHLPARGALALMPLAVLAWAPILQAFSVRRGPRWVEHQSGHVLLTWGGTALAFAIATSATFHVVRVLAGHSPAVTPALAVGILLFITLAVQAGWRLWLSRHFRHADLYG